MARTRTEEKKTNLPSEKVDKWDKLDVQIQHSGKHITLPGDPAKMPLDKAIEALKRKQADEEQEFQLHEVIDGYPLDAAVAFSKAMNNLYGWASPQTVQTFFGPQPPQMLSIKTGKGLDDVVQCPMGAFKLPGVEKNINTAIHPNLGFLVHGKIKKKEKHIILELATEARRILREESIYRGKAIRLGVDEDGDLMDQVPPEFMDVSDTGEASLIFDEDIREQIHTSILVPIKETELCRKHNIPLKRGVLLEGPYGTGKSLTARMTANLCEQNGWTFVLLDKVQGLRAALEFAKRYAPAVVFAEDIDRVIEDRTESANDLINTIDGVISKSTEIMIVLTTNFAEKLDPVILRPGRLDAVISLRAPSPDAVKKLLVTYAGSLLPEGADVAEAAKELAGQIPATIRECVERAKLGMIGRGAVTMADHDLVIAAKTMKNHLALLNRKKEEPTEAELLARSLRSVINSTDFGGEKEATQTVLDRIDRRVDNIHDHVC